MQKFGGSSLKTLPHIEAVADRVSAHVKEGHQVVVVVSAMGDTTDDLLSQAAQLRGDASPENLDILLTTGEMQSAAFMAMALSSRNVPARAMTGAQAGILTDGRHGRARIRTVDPGPVSRVLAHHIVPVVTGFQGATADGSHTTLGRGGSDLTAIALAAALKADAAEIYSDVAGVFTADPRIVADARPLPTLSYEEMIEMASQGAQVLQTEAVRYARESQVTIIARSTFDRSPGTRIAAHTQSVGAPVTAVALDPYVTTIRLVDLPDHRDIAIHVRHRFTHAGIHPDYGFLVPSLDNGRSDMVLTVRDDDKNRATDLCRQMLRDFKGAEMVVNGAVAKISVIGTEIRHHAGVTATMLQALDEAHIPVQTIIPRPMSISSVVARSEAQRGLRQIHRAFNLNHIGGVAMRARDPAQVYNS